VVNHHIRHRDHDKIIPKHHNTGANPTLRAHPEQSAKSNWASSPWSGLDQDGCLISTSEPRATHITYPP